MSRNRSKGLVSYSAVASPIGQPKAPTIEESVEVKDIKPPVEEVQEQQEAQNTVEDQDFSNEKDKSLQVDDIVSAIIDTPKQRKKKQVNFYIDVDVIEKLEKFNKKHGKGAKSNLVNEFLRKVFKM